MGKKGKIIVESDPGNSPELTFCDSIYFEII